LLYLYRQRGETSENKIRELKLDKNLQKHTVKTIRYKLYNIAGKVVSYARETILKVNDAFINLLYTIRQKAYEESLQ